MNMVMRGNPGIMKSIQESAKNVSEHNGLTQSSKVAPEVEMNIMEGGAYNSMRKRASSESIVIPPTTGSSVVKKPITEKRLLERLLESVETLPYNREYFNATSSLLTLYSMNELTEGVLNNMSREDLKEVKGIIREFQSVLDSY